MTTLMDERIKRYSKDDIQAIILDEKIHSEEVSFLTSLSTYAMVMQLPGKDEGQLAGMKPVDVVVFQVINYPTGIYQEQGQQPIILINEETSVMDYDFISELHPQHNWEIYLWIDRTWGDTDVPLGIHGEWYRSDVYPDGMRPFNGKDLGWEDKIITDEEDEDDATG